MVRVKEVGIVKWVGDGIIPGIIIVGGIINGGTIPGGIIHGIHGGIILMEIILVGIVLMVGGDTNKTKGAYEIN
jgi:hypothetical protein